MKNKFEFGLIVFLGFIISTPVLTIATGHIIGIIVGALWACLMGMVIMIYSTENIKMKNKLERIKNDI